MKSGPILDSDSCSSPVRESGESHGCQISRKYINKRSIDRSKKHKYNIRDRR